MNTFEKCPIKVIIYILGILIALFLNIYIVYLSLKKNKKMSIFDFCIFNIIFSNLCQLFSYTINFFTVSPLDSLSICIISNFNKFLYGNYRSFYFISFIIFINYNDLWYKLLWVKNNNTTTISLYVIPFILFNDIIRGKEGKTGFNRVFCYSSDYSIW